MTELFSLHLCVLSSFFLFEIVNPPDGDGGLVEMVLKRGGPGMPTQSLNDKAFMNPLFGNVGFYFSFSLLFYFIFLSLSFSSRKSRVKLKHAL